MDLVVTRSANLLNESLTQIIELLTGDMYTIHCDGGFFFIDHIIGFVFINLIRVEIVMGCNFHITVFICRCMDKLIY